MVNAAFLENFPNAASVFLNAGCLSDHSPGIIQLISQVQGIPSFKFYNIWAEHENFLKIVSSSWSDCISGTAMFSLCKKLKRLKAPLKVLNKKSFSHISSGAEVMVKELDTAQDHNSNVWGSASWHERVAGLKAKAFKLLDAEQLLFCSTC